MGRFAAFRVLCSLVLLLIVASTSFAAGPTFPSSINYAIPINVINSQGTGTPANFQEMITFNALAVCNAILCAPHLNNTEFFYSNGTVISSWYESGNGISNNYGSNDLRASSNVVVWALLSPSNYIPASGNTIIYLGFASNSVNNFNAVGTTGEAPTLTASYAKYDN